MLQGGDIDDEDVPFAVLHAAFVDPFDVLEAELFVLVAVVVEDELVFLDYFLEGEEELVPVMWFILDEHESLEVFERAVLSSSDLVKDWAVHFFELLLLKLSKRIFSESFQGFGILVVLVDFVLEIFVDPSVWVLIFFSL